MTKIQITRLLTVLAVILILLFIAVAVQAQTAVHVTYSLDGRQLHQPVPMSLSTSIKGDTLYVGSSRMTPVCVSETMQIGADDKYIHLITVNYMTDKELAEKVVASWIAKRRHATTGQRCYFAEYTRLDKEIDEECRLRADLPPSIKQMTLFQAKK